jgi:hypothetical protein
MTTIRFDLFLAYASGGKATAEALYDLLHPGVRVFLDCRTLQPGDRWDLEIPAAQRASRATVVLISSHADQIWFRADEVVTAIDLHRAAPTEHLVVPVVLEPGLTVPYGLRTVQSIVATADGGLPGVAAQLVELVTGVRTAPPRPAPPAVDTRDTRVPGIVATNCGTVVGTVTAGDNASFVFGPSRRREP